MRAFAGQICSRGPSDRVGEWLRVRIHRQKQKEEMAQRGKLGTTAAYGSPGCAIRGTKRPQDALVPAHRIKRLQRRETSGCSKLHSFDERKAPYRGNGYE